MSTESATAFYNTLGPMNPTKEKILQVAIDLFSEQGYSAVSIRDITKVVGLKESSVYNHFVNKDEILDTIFTLFKIGYSKLTPPIDRLDDILQRTTLEGFLTEGLHLYKSFVSDDVTGKIWKITHMEQFRDNRARDIFLNIIIKDTLNFLENAFQKMIDMKYIRPINPSLLASQYQYPVFAMASEYNVLKFQGLDTKEIEVKLHNHVRIFVQSVNQLHWDSI